ncbi:hypothetical protein V2J09_002778 [Rumex salicifolius]
MSLPLSLSSPFSLARSRSLRSNLLSIFLADVSLSSTFCHLFLWSALPYFEEFGDLDLSLSPLKSRSRYIECDKSKIKQGQAHMTLMDSKVPSGLLLDVASASWTI